MQLYREAAMSKYPEAQMIRALMAAGCTPVYRELCGGFTWTVPEGFNPAWLYSDRSCGHYSESPWEAALMCFQSATFQKVLDANANASTTLAANGDGEAS